eukprot:3400354-Prymnesium_polylepis.1
MAGRALEPFKLSSGGAGKRLHTALHAPPSTTSGEHSTHTKRQHPLQRIRRNICVGGGIAHLVCTRDGQRGQAEEGCCTSEQAESLPHLALEAACARHRDLGSDGVAQ